MTRVYQSPAAAGPGLRVLVVGAGRYPNAKGADEDVPALKDLTSVAPSVTEFLKRLLLNWLPDLAAPLVSVDLLLSDPAQPAGAVWKGLGVPGEAPNGTPLADASLANIRTELAATLAGTTGADSLLVLFCGHGFSKTERYFVASDFGPAGNPWSHVIDLSRLTLGLRQVPPRRQWLFWDCCADIPAAILDALAQVGDPIIQPKASKMASATKTFGQLSQFGMASSTAGDQAFGVPDKPSRFTEMLIEAVDGAGATRRQNGIWWVDDRGLVDALRTYARRKPDLKDPQFYSFVAPFTSDAPERMPLRKLPAAPTSLLIASSAPRAALKTASVLITRDGAAAPAFTQTPPGPKAVLYVPLQPLQTYIVTATINGTAHSRETFADLPLAEDVEFQVS